MPYSGMIDNAWLVGNRSVVLGSRQRRVSLDVSRGDGASVQTPVASAAVKFMFRLGEPVYYRVRVDTITLPGSGSRKNLASETVPPPQSTLLSVVK
jgi:hypothetical protein